MRQSLIPLAFLLTMLVIFSSLFSLAMGETPLSLAQVYGALVGDADVTSSLIVNDIRLPRMILTLLAGASLGMAGAALQGFLRNPIAEPSLLGISNGAALGAVLVFYTGLAGSSALAVPLAGLAGAFITGGALLALAGRFGDSNVLILAGIALSSMTGALIAIVLNLAPNPYAIMEIVHWLMGSVENRTMQDALLILPFTLLGWTLLFCCGRALDALSLGEAVASSLGICLKHTQLLLVGGTALCVGAAVSVTGSIGFIGLIVPHLLRKQVANSPRHLLWASALGGAALLTLADVLVRVIPTNSAELKLGIVTTLIGIPFFLHLIWQSRKGASS
jgi:iron complex transport system permease protein